MKGISFLFFAIFAGCTSNNKKIVDPIRTAMLTKNDEYRECFLESDSYKGRRAKEIEGVIQIHFIINPEGKAIEGKVVESPFIDPNLHACLLSMVRRIQFPLPLNGEPIDVYQPINFHSVY